MIIPNRIQTYPTTMSPLEKKNCKSLVLSASHWTFEVVHLYHFCFSLPLTDSSTHSSQWLSPVLQRSLSGSLMYLVTIMVSSLSLSPSASLLQSNRPSNPSINIFLLYFWEPMLPCLLIIHWLHLLSPSYHTLQYCRIPITILHLNFNDSFFLHLQPIS